MGLRVDWWVTSRASFSSFWNNQTNNARGFYPKRTISWYLWLFLGPEDINFTFLGGGPVLYSNLPTHQRAPNTHTHPFTVEFPYLAGSRQGILVPSTAVSQTVYMYLKILCASANCIWSSGQVLEHLVNTSQRRQVTYDFTLTYLIWKLWQDFCNKSILWYGFIPFFCNTSEHV